MGSGSWDWPLLVAGGVLRSVPEVLVGAESDEESIASGAELDPQAVAKRIVRMMAAIRLRCHLGVTSGGGGGCSA